MKKMACVIAAVALLGLAGCAAVAPGAEKSVSGASIAPPTSDATPTAAPLTIQADAPEKAAVESAATGMVEDGESLFLEAVRRSLYGMESTTDEELLAAGLYTCEQLDAGGKRSTIIAISGESGSEPAPGMNNATVMLAATRSLCVQHDGDGSY